MENVVVSDVIPLNELDKTTGRVEGTQGAKQDETSMKSGLRFSLRLFFTACPHTSRHLLVSFFSVFNVALSIARPRAAKRRRVELTAADPSAVPGLRDSFRSREKRLKEASLGQEDDELYGLRLACAIDNTRTDHGPRAHTDSSSLVDNLTNAAASHRPDTRFDNTGVLLQCISELEPTLTVNIHLTHFSLDNQTTKIKYSGSNKAFLKAIDHNRLPPELAGHLPGSFYDGLAVVEVRDFRSTSLATKAPSFRLLLKPTTESIVSECNTLWENATPENAPLLDSDLLDIEERVVRRSQTPLCLEPSVTVARTMNHINFNARKWIVAGDTPPYDFTSKGALRLLQTKSKLDSRGQHSGKGSFITSKPSKKKSVAHGIDLFSHVGVTLKSSKHDTKPSPEEIATRARSVCGSILRLAPDYEQRKSSMVQKIMDPTSHAMLMSHQKVIEPKVEEQDPNPLNPPAKRTLRFQFGTTAVQLDTFPGPSGEFEGLLRSATAGATASLTHQAFRLGHEEFAKQFSCQCKQVLLREGQLCILDSAPGGVTSKMPTPAQQAAMQQAQYAQVNIRQGQAQAQQATKQQTAIPFFRQHSQQFQQQALLRGQVPAYQTGQMQPQKQMHGTPGGQQQAAHLQQARLPGSSPAPGSPSSHITNVTMQSPPHHYGIRQGQYMPRPNMGQQHVRSSRSQQQALMQQQQAMLAASISRPTTGQKGGVVIPQGGANTLPTSAAMLSPRGQTGVARATAGQVTGYRQQAGPQPGNVSYQQIQQMGRQMPAGYPQMQHVQNNPELAAIVQQQAQRQVQAQLAHIGGKGIPRGAVPANALQQHQQHATQMAARQAQIHQEAHQGQNTNVPRKQ